MEHCQHPGCPNVAVINDTWCMAHCPAGTLITVLRGPEVDPAPPGLAVTAQDDGVCFGLSAPRVLTAAERAAIERWLNARYSLF